MVTIPAGHLYDVAGDDVARGDKIIWKDGEVPHIPMIAIVDDDEAVRASIANLIRSLGFHADPFASGEELLRSHRLDDTCCVITDMRMPGMTGLELQGLLLARRRTMPIIFINAYPEERTRRDALAAGALGFFGKPFDGAALIHCIEHALNGSCGSKPTPPH
jgi:FixJ family two-component response regulator